MERRRERRIPREACLPELFAAAAPRPCPDAPAVVGGRRRGLDLPPAGRGGEPAGAPPARAGRGAGDARWASCVERSPELIVGILAILKAGGAYVPLDPGLSGRAPGLHAGGRGRAAVLVHESSRARIAVLAALALLDVDAAMRRRRRRRGAALSRRSPAESLAYVIYTSGSTGRPKGVAVPHRAVVRLVRETNYVRLGPGDRIGHVANISFDAATCEIWGALLNGAAVVVIPREVVLSPRAFAAALREQRVTSMFLTTALFTRMARGGAGRLRGDERAAGRRRGGRPGGGADGAGRPAAAAAAQRLRPDREHDVRDLAPDPGGAGGGGGTSRSAGRWPTRRSTCWTAGRQPVPPGVAGRAVPRRRRPGPRATGTGRS